MRRNLLIPLLAFPTVACSTTEPTDGVDPNAPRYYEDVAPILADNCFACHNENGAGPFVLETYEQAKSLGELLPFVVEARVMPPWLAWEGTELPMPEDQDRCQVSMQTGDVRHYEASAWLSDDDVATIRAWVDGGMAEGDPAKGPVFSADVEHLPESEPMLSMPDTYVPNDAQLDDYRCFVVDPGFNNRKYVTSYEVLPGDPKVVHHVIVYSPRTQEAADEAYALDAADPAMGYECFGGPGPDDSYVVAAWAPGRQIWEYPEGTGVPIDPNMPQIIQMHYNVQEGVAPDLSRVRLEVVDEIETELFPWFFANTALELPPGQSRLKSELEISPRAYFPEADMPGLAAYPQNIVGVAAHMHQVGKSERIEITKADGTDTSCVLEVPRWDFNWQFAYMLEEPVRLEPDDLIRMSCWYDTSDRTEPTYWGDGTYDEMCLALFFSTFDGGVIPPLQ